MAQYKFNCTETYQTFTLNKGIYEFHLFGVQGGSKKGGHGDHYYRVIKLLARTYFYAFVGGKGEVISGGFK